MWQPGSPVPGVGYDLPAGYAMFNGTSMASPQAAGGGALLLSAAKATGVAVTPAAMRQSMYSTAQPIDGVSVNGQGTGLLDVRQAWKLLKQGVATQTYAVSAPICTEINLIIGETAGTGVYNRCSADRGGQRAGEARTYDVTVTRTSGCRERSATPSAGSAMTAPGRRESPCGCRSTPRWSSRSAPSPRQAPTAPSCA